MITESLYQEIILDHYKNPRNHGLLDPADARAEGQNPLCGDEITVSVRLGEGDVIEEVGFDGRGCAISQAATSMLSDLVKGKTARMPVAVVRGYDWVPDDTATMRPVIRDASRDLFR